MTETQQQPAVMGSESTSKPDAYTVWYAIWTSAFAALGYVIIILHHLYLDLFFLDLLALILAATLVISLIINVIGQRWRRTLSIIAAPGIAGLLFALLVWLGLWLGIEPLSQWQVESSSVSPDDKLIAENSTGGEDEAPIGRVSVRRRWGRIIYETVFKEPTQSLFLRWTDSTHLLVLSDSQYSLPAITETESDGSIGVTYSTYIRYDAADASRLAKSHLALFLGAADISTAVSEENRSRPGGPGLHSCEFKLSAKDGKEFSEIGFTIRTMIFESGPGRLKGKSWSAGFASNFKVGQRIDATENALLTSATISEIPSDGNVPDGMGFRTIMGGFGGPRAPLLVEALGKDTFYIDYNFDFDQQNVRYGVPATAISDSFTKFKSCIGDGTYWDGTPMPTK
jgi:hypothetical protein